jgi:hypothetical protein
MIRLDEWHMLLGLVVELFRGKKASAHDDG